MCAPILPFLALLATGPSGPVSLYSDLASERCATARVEADSGASEQRCPGVAGFHLIVQDDDSRMSIAIVTPDGKEHPLHFWEVVTSGFSSLGERAEWRVRRGKERDTPIALIVRLNAQEDPNSTRLTSWLTVSKITTQEICVTDRIPPGPKANEEARAAADSAARRPCLGPRGE